MSSPWRESALQCYWLLCRIRPPPPPPPPAQLLSGCQSHTGCSARKKWWGNHAENQSLCSPPAAYTFMAHELGLSRLIPTFAKFLLPCKINRGNIWEMCVWGGQTMTAHWAQHKYSAVYTSQCTNIDFLAFCSHTQNSYFSVFQRLGGRNIRDKMVLPGISLKCCIMGLCIWWKTNEPGKALILLFLTLFTAPQS